MARTAGRVESAILAPAVVISQRSQPSWATLRRDPEAPKTPRKALLLQTSDRAADAVL